MIIKSIVIVIITITNVITYDNKHVANDDNNHHDCHHDGQHHDLNSAENGDYGNYDDENGDDDCHHHGLHHAAQISHDLIAMIVV